MSNKEIKNSKLRASAFTSPPHSPLNRQIFTHLLERVEVLTIGMITHDLYEEMEYPCDDGNYMTIRCICNGC